MDLINIGDWVVEVDVKKTRDFYEKYHLITEDCSCDYCANFIIACEKLSPELINTFISLGIDPRKEGEVFELTENEDNTHLYGAFYHLVGRIVKGPKPNKEGIQASTLSGVEMTFSEDLSLVPKGFPKPTIQFEIQVNVPRYL